MPKLPTIEFDIDRLREVLNYDPETGIFTWRITRRSVAQAGRIAGCLHSGGSIYLRVDGKALQAHRVAWAMQTGAWPKDEIDHINRVRNDNRLVNLREATRAQNLHNRGASKCNTSGFKGVFMCRESGRFRAQVRFSGNKKWSARFKTKEEAYAAYCEKAAELHGEFARF